MSPRHVLVTGAAGGIGLAVAEAFAARGDTQRRPRRRRCTRRDELARRGRPPTRWSSPTSPTRAAPRSSSRRPAGRPGRRPGQRGGHLPRDTARRHDRGGLGPRAAGQRARAGAADRGPRPAHGRPAVRGQHQLRGRDQGAPRGRPLLHVEGRAGDGDQGVRGRARRAWASASTPSRPASSRSTARSTRSPTRTPRRCRPTRSGAPGRPEEIAAAVVWLAGDGGRLRHRRRAARRRRGHRGHRGAAPAPHPRHRAAGRGPLSGGEDRASTVRHRRGGSHRRHPRPPPGPRRTPGHRGGRRRRSTSRRIERGRPRRRARCGAQRGPGGAGPHARIRTSGRCAWSGSCSR